MSGGGSGGGPIFGQTDASVSIEDAAAELGFSVQVGSKGGGGKGGRKKKWKKMD